MPHTFAPACSFPGCRHLRPCPIHRFAGPRASSSERGYGHKWRKAALAWLRTHPDCVDCGAPATDVDHEIPHRGDMELFWDSSLWRSRCHRHHSRKTVRFDGGFGRPRVRRP